MKKQSYNWLFLRGDKHITDERYQELQAAEGIEVRDEELYTVDVNRSYLEVYPDRADYITKRLAALGLMEVKNEEL